MIKKGDRVKIISHPVGLCEDMDCGGLTSRMIESVGGLFTVYNANYDEGIRPTIQLEGLPYIFNPCMLEIVESKPVPVSYDLDYLRGQDGV